MRFGAYLAFASLWACLIYAPMAHWVWGGGWLQDRHVMDFAGGVPVEMASGFSALAAAMVVGARKDFGRQAILPHNGVYALLGASLLWFGWFGFNAGSALTTGAQAPLAFHQHAASTGGHALDLDADRLPARAQGDGDRGGDGDRRRGGRYHSGARLRRPDERHLARGAGGAARLRADRLAAAHAARRDARRARGRTASPASPGSSSSASSPSCAGTE